MIPTRRSCSISINSFSSRTRQQRNQSKRLRKNSTSTTTSSFCSLSPVVTSGIFIAARTTKTLLLTTTMFLATVSSSLARKTPLSLAWIHPSSSLLSSFQNRNIHRRLLNSGVPSALHKLSGRGGCDKAQILTRNNNCFVSRYASITSENDDTSHAIPNSPITANNDDSNPQNIHKGTEKKNNKRRKKKNRAARDKRREFIGKAKAVDRGQWSVVYAPGGEDGLSFASKSGLPDRSRPFVVLGIESSCDDTGAAVVRSDGVILGESLASQQEIHEEWGGVVPGLAKNAHEEKIDGVVDEAIRNAGLSSVEEVDAIGVTVGPGLEICLRVGCNKARALASKYQKPFVGIHHLEAHILMARLPFDNERAFRVPATENTHELERAVEFPFLALLVSGGHCQLLKCLGIGRYTIIGGTIDDSLGEAFDKTARLLGLPVGGGGGPAVEALAKEGDPKSVSLPIPLQKRKDCDFSYAGLKTAVRVAADKLRTERGLESIDDLSREDKANIAASFQNVSIKHIEQRLERAMSMIESEEDGIRSLAVVGGVAANKELRSRLETVCANRDDPWKMFVPPPRLCTDQGSMSAWAAIERIMVGSSDIPNDQEVYARYPFQLTK